MASRSLSTLVKSSKSATGLINIGVSAKIIIRLKIMLSNNAKKEANNALNVKIIFMIKKNNKINSKQTNHKADKINVKAIMNSVIVNLKTAISRLITRLNANIRTITSHKANKINAKSVMSSVISNVKMFKIAKINVNNTKVMSAS